MAESEGWQIRLRLDYFSSEAMDLDPVDERTMKALAWFARTNSYCFPKNSDLEGMLRRKERAVQSSLERLEKSGWIERIVYQESNITQRLLILLRKRVDDKRCSDNLGQLEIALDHVRSNIAKPYIHPYWLSGRSLPDLPSVIKYVLSIDPSVYAARREEQRRTSSKVDPHVVDDNAARRPTFSRTSSTTPELGRSERASANERRTNDDVHSPTLMASAPSVLPIANDVNTKDNANPQSDAKPNYRARSNWNSSLATVTAAVAYGVEHPLNGWSTTKEPQPEIVAMLTEWAYGVPDRLKAAGLTLDPMAIVAHVAGQYYHTVWIEVCERLLTVHIANKICDSGQ